LLAGEFPKDEYLGRVIELRRQYWLLSIPVERWSRREQHQTSASPGDQIR
jgi:hypothetical protein